MTSTFVSVSAMGLPSCPVFGNLVEANRRPLRIAFSADSNTRTESAVRRQGSSECPSARSTRSATYSSPT
jgi:hypothetical protein